MTAKCEKAGFENSIAIIPTFNVTHQQNTQVGSAGGLLGVLIMAGVNAVSDPTNDRFMYQFRPIMMKPGASNISDKVKSGGIKPSVSASRGEIKTPKSDNIEQPVSGTKNKIEPNQPNDVSVTAVENHHSREKTIDNSFSYTALTPTPEISRV